MKKLILMILALGAVSAAIGQKPPKGFEVRYDKFKDETQVSFRERDYPAGITLAGWFRHKGQILDGDQREFLLTFEGTTCSGYCFKSGTRAIFLIDGDRLELPEKDVLSDFVTYTIDRDLFERLTKAKLIEFQVGYFEGRWRDKDIGRFKTLLDLGTVKIADTKRENQ